MYPLANYEHIHCLLDNDPAGRKAVEDIQKEYSWRVRDSSYLYSGHKDLNDFLCGKRMEKAEKVVPPDKKFQSTKQQKPEEKNKQAPGEKRKSGRRL